MIRARAQRAENLHLLSAYDYELPEELIAQKPCNPRDHSRLLLVDRKKGNLSECKFYEFAKLLGAGDSVVFNDTRVIPARLKGVRAGGGKTEICLIRKRDDKLWETLAKPGKKLRIGSLITFDNKLQGEVVEILPDGGRVIRFLCKGSFNQHLQRIGQMPLPPYIRRQPEKAIDHRCYQTIFANKEGAVAAPTAGLHFTRELLQTLTTQGVEQTAITLHVGLGTFKPVFVEDIRDHQMHCETVEIEKAAAARLNARLSYGRQICVGTTVCRALEAAASSSGIIQPGSYETDIFIYPGYQFQYVRSMLTNFHLPKSTLLTLVCAFAGYELTMEAYAYAVKEKFRFYSYGDAMLIF